MLVLIGLMVLMVPVAYAPEPPDEYGPTSSEVWLEVDSMVAEPYYGGIRLSIDSRVFFMNVGDRVAHIGWVYEIPEIKRKQEPWTWVCKIGSPLDLSIDPGQTGEIPFGYGIVVFDAKAFRILAEVELLNHPTGICVFHYIESFGLPEM